MGSRIESKRSGQMGCNPSTQAGKAKDHKFKASLGHIVSSSQLVVRAYLKNHHESTACSTGPDCVQSPSTRLRSTLVYFKT